MDQAYLYEIRVEGELPSNWSDWFEGMTIRPGLPGESVLAGSLADQAALHGVLAKIRDLNLKLISITRGDLPAQHCKEHKGENNEGTQGRV